MATYRAVQITEAGGSFELVEKEERALERGEVRVTVEACGVCHSDSITKEGHMPGIAYPRVPGHEIAGRIAEVADDVVGGEAGQRGGVGWFGGNCGHCEPCRRGELVDCRNLMIPGIVYDGGYAEQVVVPAGALAKVPDELSSEDAAPLLCAGITTFNAIRNSGARAGDVVAILGIGGLGHLGVQFARRLGFEVVAIARGAEKGDLAKELGAHHYIDSLTEDVGERLGELGGAKLIVATVTNAQAMTAAAKGLGVQGEMVVVGVSPEPLEVVPMDLVMHSSGISGHASGAAIDSEDTLKVAALTDVRPQIETMPLEEAEAAYDRMMSGDARFRVVITTGA